MAANTPEGGKTRRLFITVVAAIVILLIAAVIYYVFVYNKSDSGADDNRTLSTSMKSTKVEKLTKQNSHYSLSVGTSTLNALTKITNFEDDNEKWQGGGVYDTQIVYEGDQSLNLISVDHKEVTSYLKKSLDLSDLEYLEFMLHVNDVTAFESMLVELGDLDMKNYYQYTLSNVSAGWQLIQVPKKQFATYIDAKSDFGWNKIQKMQFKLTSRADAILMVRLDMLKVINSSYTFTKEWKVYNDQEKKFLGLYLGSDKLGKKFVARSIGANTAILDAVKNATDFIFTAAIAPQSQGSFGLFARGNYNNGYGYYFLIDGERSNSWRINRLDSKGWLPAEKVIKGDIGNEVFQSDKEYWLRVEARGSKLEFFLSFDDDTYYKLGELKDAEFRSGGLGVAVIDGWGTFDNIMVKKL